MYALKDHVGVNTYALKDHVGTVKILLIMCAHKIRSCSPWTTPGFKGRTLKLCVFTGWDTLISVSAAPHCRDKNNMKEDGEQGNKNIQMSNKLNEETVDFISASGLQI